MGLHRTLLFLLVLGLIIAAFRRGGSGPPDQDCSCTRSGAGSLILAVENSSVIVPAYCQKIACPSAKEMVDLYE